MLAAIEMILYYGKGIEEIMLWDYRGKRMTMGRRLENRDIRGRKKEIKWERMLQKNTLEKKKFVVNC